MLCREISALISILQGRMVVFFNGQQPFPSYLLQGKIVGAGGGGDLFGSQLFSGPCLLLSITLRVIE